MRKFFIFAFIFSVLTVGVVFVSAFILHTSKPTPPVVQKPVQTKVTIIEGWTLNDIAKNLDYSPKRQDVPHLVAMQDFLDTAKNFNVANYQLLSSKPAKASLEGFLYPDTYFVPLPGPSTSVSSVLIKKALDNFENKFTPEMVEAANKRGMSVYEIITLASIVKKETGRNAVTEDQQTRLAEERKIIAGIFYNRLTIDMPLQSDATVNYITQKNTPSASAQDIEINSPYNTYKYKGLPPGPIANPSLSSILAALYPTKTDYMYFFHKQPGGEPVYSKTFEEHIANEKKYLK